MHLTPRPRTRMTLPVGRPQSRHAEHTIKFHSQNDDNIRYSGTGNLPAYYKHLTVASMHNAVLSARRVCAACIVTIVTCILTCAGAA